MYYYFNIETYAIVAQLVEQFTRNEQATGSSPVDSSIYCAGVAQWQSSSFPS